MDESSLRILDLLASRTNYERQRVDRPRLGLETMRALADRLQIRRCAPHVVQIGGSKGKGTTAAWLETLAGAAGLRVGVYGSPHVYTLLERVRVGGSLVDGATLEQAVREVVDASEGLAPAATFFEIVTAAAALCFKRASVDLAVLEVGLGGRLDATTALEADVGVVTTIELEHTEILGDTTAQIAGEKAYVLRPQGHGLHAVEDPAARRVLEQHAARVGCRLEVRGRDFDARRIAPDEVELLRGCRRVRVAADPLPDYETAAVALAWAALGARLPDAAPPARLGRPPLPGRLERRREPDGQILVLDGAHTERSAALLAGELGRLGADRRWAILFATAAGKRWREALRLLVPLADTVYVTRLRDTASVDPDEIVAELARSGVPARAVDSAVEGLAALRAHHGPRLVTGSFYLVGEIGTASGEIPADPP